MQGSKFTYDSADDVSLPSSERATWICIYSTNGGAAKWTPLFLYTTSISALSLMSQAGLATLGTASTHFKRLPAR